MLPGRQKVGVWDMRLSKLHTRMLLIGMLVVVGGFIVLRHVGIPVPEVVDMTKLQGRVLELAGRTFGWRLTLRYPNGQIKARVLFWESDSGHLLRLGRFYDPEGNLRSRVDGGNGFLFLFYDNGVPMELTGYLSGRRCGPSLIWDEDGKLLRAEYRDQTGSVLWSYECTRLAK